MAWPHDREMRLTATILVHQYTCPFLRYVMYEVKQPLPIAWKRRRFGTLLHAAIAEYERCERSLTKAIEILEGNSECLRSENIDEARRILEWRDGERGRGGGRPFLIEGPLSTSVAGHRLDVRMDRLDREGDDLVLVEIKSGKRADLPVVRAQLAILAYAVLRIFGRPPQAWRLELLGTRRILDLPATTDPGELERFTATLAESVARGDREPQPFDPRFCARCPARAWCPRATESPRLLLRNTSTPQEQLVLFPP